MKVTVVGNTNVGKTTLVHRMVYNTLPADPVLTTIGADFHVLPGDTAVHIWDTGNLERFGQISAQYYKNTNVFLIVYDCANAVSACAALSKWNALLKSRCSQYNDTLPVIAVRSKIDQIGSEVPNIVESYCDQHNMKHVSVSAQENIDVDVLVNLIRQSAPKQSDAIRLTPVIHNRKSTCSGCI